MCLCSHAEQPAEGLTTMAMCVCVADVPLDIDVTHVLPGDTRLIKGNVGRVPHDDPQDVSEKLPKSYPKVTQKLPKSYPKGKILALVDVMLFFLGFQTVLKVLKVLFVC